ncbi:MAG: cell division protein ZapA [Clostridia bacterium]|nr:cell division protein ZapA [Clostridia bacterium]
MNRINITINSRVYTVVAEEEEGYLKRLCDYVNEKVKLVINEGTHVMGEKPLVLAALNICDEYFKLLDSTNPVQNISEIIAKNKQLEAELRELRKDGGNAAEKIEELRSEAALAEKMFDETEEKVKFLEGQIRLMESRLKQQRGEFAIREKELLDMLESK